MDKVVILGEVLLRFATQKNLRFSQSQTFVQSLGGEADVAVSLSNLGVKTELITRLPQNEISEICLMELKKYGVDTSHMVFGGERMGLCFYEKGSVSRKSRLVSDRTGSAMSQIMPGMINWDEVFKDATWFHWSGVTPGLSQGAADVCLEAIKAANIRGITVSCDLDYKRSLWKYGKKASEVMSTLVDGCDLIFGDEEDADGLFDIKPRGYEITTSGENIDAGKYKSVCLQLMARFPRAWKVVLSLRGLINSDHNIVTGVLYDGTQLYRTSKYDITNVVDRGGCGDAFAAAMIYGFLNFVGQPQMALDFATAAFCLKHTIEGELNIVTKEEILRLMSGDCFGRISV